MPFAVDIPFLDYKYRNRQCSFYSSCLRTLKEESRRSWTILIDDDEYLNFNHYDDKEEEPGHCRAMQHAYNYSSNPQSKGRISERD